MNKLLIIKVRNWFFQRNLQHAPIAGQLKKLQEEVDELVQAFSDRNIAEVKDAIGDIIVVLIGITVILLTQYGISVSLEECLSLAYEEIKDRTGNFNEETGMWEKDEQSKNTTK